MGAGGSWVIARLQLEPAVAAQLSDAQGRCTNRGLEHPKSEQFGIQTKAILGFLGGLIYGYDMIIHDMTMLYYVIYVLILFVPSRA